MKILAKKMNKLGLLKFHFITGTLTMAIAMILLPVGIISIDLSLMTNPYILGFVLIAMLGFGLVGYFYCIRPYISYNKLPEVQLEADDEFLYIHTKKEAKIPLASLSNVVVTVRLPYLLQKEFLREFLIHLFSYQYGDLELDIPGYGSYRICFVANAQDVSLEVIDFLDKVAK